MNKNNGAGGFFGGASARQILVAVVFVAILGGFFVLNRLITPPDVSQSERRELAKLPELTISTLASGEFMDGFESFASDSFVFRDGLRTVRAASVFGLFLQTDKSGLYLGDSGAGKFERIDAESYRKAADKINKLADSLPGLNLYCAVVPDKSIYSGKYLPGFEPSEAREILSERLDGVKYVDITDALDGGDFYRTDLHWDQTRLDGVCAALYAAMNISPESAMPDGGITTAGGFYGVYAGQLALPVAEDTMSYVTNGYIDGASVSYLNARTGELEPGPMYDAESFSGRDPYDLFLKGVQPLIVIDSPNSRTDRELYMFRDSFSSSLAPLLTSEYRRVTLIDLRYLDSRMLPSLVEFKPGADVLFIYSTQILNNESVLLVG
ncbi:MAG: hypothetical protein LBS51_03840 [Oscillospiraceae bacterium]|jgi:hypothetical protein|nr:hypothetical protein [Oscillospiraceae bacterium]